MYANYIASCLYTCNTTRSSKYYMVTSVLAYLLNYLRVILVTADIHKVTKECKRDLCMSLAHFQPSQVWLLLAAMQSQMNRSPRQKNMDFQNRSRPLCLLQTIRHLWTSTCLVFWEDILDDVIDNYECHLTVVISTSTASCKLSSVVPGQISSTMRLSTIFLCRNLLLKKVGLALTSMFWSISLLDICLCTLAVCLCCLMPKVGMEIWT